MIPGGPVLARVTRAIEQGKLPGVKVWCTDYRDFNPTEKYDALQSIEMIDHLCSPAQANQGLAIDIYDDCETRNFEAALEAGFVAAGVNVMLIGPLPTPGITPSDTSGKPNFAPRPATTDSATVCQPGSGSQTTRTPLASV